MSAAVERARVRQRLSKLIRGALLEMARRRGVDPRELSEDALTLERLALSSWAARDADLTAEKPKQWPTPTVAKREPPVRLPGPPPLPAGVRPSRRPTAPPLPPPPPAEPESEHERDTVRVPRDSYPQIEMSEVDFSDADTAPKTPAALSKRLRGGL